MYEDTFGTDWETLDSRDEVIRRAYALGVATRLGASHPDELERLNAQTESTYDRSFVELAYQKGRDEAAAATADGLNEIWEQLVESKTVIDPFGRDEDVEWDDPVGETSLPDALGLIDIDTLPDDSTERVRQPSLLDRESDPHPAASGSEERTVFGRPVSDVRSSSNGDGARSSSDDETEDDADDTGSSASESTADHQSSTAGQTADDHAAGDDARTGPSDGSSSEPDRDE